MKQRIISLAQPIPKIKRFELIVEISQQILAPRYRFRSILRLNPPVVSNRPRRVLIRGGDVRAGNRLGTH